MFMNLNSIVLCWITTYTKNGEGEKERERSRISINCLNIKTNRNILGADNCTYTYNRHALNAQSNLQSPSEMFKNTGTHTHTFTHTHTNKRTNTHTL